MQHGFRPDLSTVMELVILFHLFGGKVMRFSGLERAIPNITQTYAGMIVLRVAEGGGLLTLKRPSANHQ